MVKQVLLRLVQIVPGLFPEHPQEVNGLFGQGQVLFLLPGVGVGNSSQMHKSRGTEGEDQGREGDFQAGDPASGLLGRLLKGPLLGAPGLLLLGLLFLTHLVKTPILDGITLIFIFGIRHSHLHHVVLSKIGYNSNGMASATCSRACTSARHSGVMGVSVVSRMIFWPRSRS